MHYSLMAVLAAAAAVSGLIAPELDFKTLSVTLENQSAEDLYLPVLRYEARGREIRHKTYIDWATILANQTSETKPIRYLYRGHQPAMAKMLARVGLKDTWSIEFDLRDGKFCSSSKDDGTSMKPWDPHAIGFKAVGAMTIQFHGATWDTLGFKIIAAGHASDGQISCTY